MKKLLLILLIPMIGFGQSVPQGINYQAVARDSIGAVLVNQGLTIQFSIISDITTGNITWQETHQDSTNSYGLFTAIIGQGTSTSVGSSLSFDVIDWGTSNHFLKVEVDYGGGLIDMGTTAFMSVPYAIHTSIPKSEKNRSILPFYNMNLTGNASYGGTGSSQGVQENNYMKFFPIFSTHIMTSDFGFGDYNKYTGDRPINSKFHILEDILVTGIYLNTPYIDNASFTSTTNPIGGLFGYGANDYIDLEIYSPTTGYKKVYRIGNPSSGDQDTYYFPSSAFNAFGAGGIKINLPESDWILIPAGMNMNRVLRFKYHINSNLWIRNNYSGTDFNYSQINGYLMYISE